MLSTDEPACKQKSPAQYIEIYTTTCGKLTAKMSSQALNSVLCRDYIIRQNTYFMLRQLKSFITTYVFLRSSIFSSQSSHYTCCTPHSQISSWGSGIFPELNECLRAICQCRAHKGMSSICREIPVLSSFCSYDKIIPQSPNTMHLTTNYQLLK